MADPKSASSAAIQSRYPDRLRTSSRGTIRFGIVLVFLLFAVGGSWAMMAQLSGAIVTSGFVTVAGRAKQVQHPDGGVVADILVEDGDMVARGDVLLRLDGSLLMTERRLQEGRMREAAARKARLSAERDNAAEVLWETGLLAANDVTVNLEVRRGEERLFRARRQTRSGQISGIAERIEQHTNQIDGATAMIASNTRQIASLDEELIGVRSLQEKGLAPVSRVLSLERQQETLIGRIGEQNAEIARLKNAINQAEIELLQIDREFVQNVLAELRQLQTDIVDATQRLAAVREKLRRTEIRAPVSGVVHELSVANAGAVISAGQEIATIVPQTDRFEIEVPIEPQFVDAIHRGQHVVLSFAAFDEVKTPDLNGTVSGISADVVQDSKTGASIYLARIGVARSEIERLGDRDLIPGMPVDAFITTGSRTFLNYLLKPLSDQVRRALREE
ncbi:MAG: HlyD family type I secretion periplasmic adaptor subunit [Pseudomonadota bacterium]